MEKPSLLILCTILCAGAAIFLVSSRIIPGIVIVSPFLIALAVYCTIRMENPITGLFLVSMTTVLTLSLRFSSLTWGDPWQDYESVMEVIVQGSTSPSGYRLQQPILPAIVSTLSLVTGLSPLLIQKISIPIIGSLSVPILYICSRTYVGQRAALLASFIFLAGIPYIHWASQGVRETIGIPFFLLALFGTIAVIQEKNYRDVISLVPVLVGLILAHHQSAIFLVAIMTGVVLVALYFFCRREDIMGVAYTGIIFFWGMLGVILLWWEIRIPFIFLSFIGTINKSLSYKPSGSILPLIFICLIISFFILIPVLWRDLPGKIQHMVNTRSFYLTIMLQVTQIFLIAGMIIFGVLLLMGLTSFSVSYSPFMIIPILCIFIAAIAGIPHFLSASRIFILIWVMIPGFLLVTGFLIAIPLNNSSWNLQIDPFRFIGYLWPAVSIVAGLTLIQKIQNFRIIQIIVPMVFIILLMNSFPPVVFQGEETDNRSLVISHSNDELSAVTWFQEQNLTGRFSSDRYGMSSARWLNPLGYTVIEPLGRPGKWNGTEYWMITERMKKYANFNEWIVKNPHPITNEELTSFEMMTSRMYDNGNAGVYKVEKNLK